MSSSAAICARSRRTIILIGALLIALFSYSANAQEPGWLERLFGSDDESYACPESAYHIAAAATWPNSCGKATPPYALSGSDAAVAARMEGVWEIEIRRDGVRHSWVGFLTKGLSGAAPRDVNAPWAIVGNTTGVISAPELPFISGNFRVEPSAVTTNGLQVTFAGYDIDVSVSQSGTMMSGHWKQGDESGVTVWRKRPKPRLREVSFNSNWAREDGTRVIDIITPGSRPAKLEASHPVSCGYGNMRGNCRLVYIEIYGDHLAGGHDVWLNPGTHLELLDTRYIFTNGGTFPVAGALAWASSSRHFVKGISLQFALWGGGKPGPQVLWFDGEPIPFEFIIHNYPDEQEDPVLLTLNAVGSDGAALDKLVEGQPFRLLAEFDGEHDDTWVSAEVPAPGDQEGASVEPRASAVLWRQEDKRKFASGWLTIGADGATNAEVPQSLRLSESLDDHDAAGSRAALAAYFAGVWSVEIAEDESQAARVGTVEISDDGMSAILALDGSNGEKTYELNEADVRTSGEENAGDDASDTPTDETVSAVSLVTRFQRTIDIEDPPGGSNPLLDSSQRINLPIGENSILFRIPQHSGEADGAEEGVVGLLSELVRPVEWQDDESDGLQFQLSTGRSEQELAGQVFRERAGELNDLGSALWSRHTTSITDVFVIDDQAMPDAAYPFDVEEQPLDGRKRTRTLLVVGDPLPAKDALERATSSDESVEYLFEEVEEQRREALIGEAKGRIDTQLERAKAAPQQDDAAIGRLELQKQRLETGKPQILQAVLEAGVTPGIKELVVDEVGKAWPLLFGDQKATLKFVRPDDQYGSEHTPAYFLGDEGAVELEFKSAIPYETVGLQLIRRNLNAAEGEPSELIGTVDAVLVDQGTTLGNREIISTYRSDSLSFPAQGGDSSGSADSLVVPVAQDDILGVRLFDPVTAYTQPLIAMAKVYGDPSELGELWKDALGKVAQCDSEQFDGDELYALQTSTRISRFVVGEFLMQTASYVSPLAAAAVAYSGSDGPVDFDPSVNVLKGDHAAAILIRDELVEVLADPRLTQLNASHANNRNGEIEAMRAAALAAGSVEDYPVIANYEGEWHATYDSHFFTWLSGKVTGAPYIPVMIPLAETLDSAKLADSLGISQPEAEKWAVEQTQAAAERYTSALASAIGRAQQAGDCDLEELLIVSGQRADAAVMRILPRLVKKVPREGSPGSSYWTSDKLAQGFVKRLHVVGTASRALDEYATIDDAYKAMAVAAVTAGAGAALSGAGYGSAAAYAVLAGDLADMAYFGLEGVDNFIEAEDYYNYAVGGASVFGQDAVDAANDQRESGALALVGLAAPGISGIINMKNLRSLKNVQKGKALFEAKGPSVLANLDSITDDEKLQLAAYLDSAVGKMQRSGIEALDDAEVSAMHAASSMRGGTIPPPSVADDVDVDGFGLPSRAIGAPDSPYNAPVVDRFSRQQRFEGRVNQGEVYYDENAKDFGVLLDGATFSNGLTGEEIKIGRRLGGGAFTTVYADEAADSDWVLKARMVPAADHAKVGSIEKLVNDSETGYKLLSDLAEDATFFRTPARQGEPVWVPDPTNTGSGFFLTREESIADEVNGKVVTSAFERFEARGTPGNPGKPTPNEALTINLAVRELNQKGIVWADSKLKNLDVVPDPSSPTGHKVIFFDYDGFRPVKGDMPGPGTTAEKMWRQARGSQQIVDGLSNPDNYYGVYGKVYNNFDHRIFGQEMTVLPMSGGTHKNSELYDQFNAQDPAAFREGLRRLEQRYGVKIPYNPPGS